MVLPAREPLTEAALAVPYPTLGLAKELRDRPLGWGHWSRPVAPVSTPVVIGVFRSKGPMPARQRPFQKPPVKQGPFIF